MFSFMIPKRNPPGSCMYSIAQRHTNITNPNCSAIFGVMFLTSHLYINVQRTRMFLISFCQEIFLGGWWKKSRSSAIFTSIPNTHGVWCIYLYLHPKLSSFVGIARPAPLSVWIYFWAPLLSVISGLREFWKRILGVKISERFCGEASRFCGEKQSPLSLGNPGNPGIYIYTLR